MSDQPAKASNKPELLIAAVLAHYRTSNTLNKDRQVCVKLAAVIKRHLTILSELPAELSNLGPVLRTTCEQLDQWTRVIEHTLPQQDKFAR